jgi:predicted O-methyltransferase YrrM
LSQHFNLSAGFSRLKSASSADVKRWITTLPVVLSAPAILGTVDALCKMFHDTTHDQAHVLASEFSGDRDLLSRLENSMLLKRGRQLNWQKWHPFVYGAIRIMRPQVVFETGVFDGRSSAVILAAMFRNATGELVSIDLPSREEIPNATDKMCGGTQTSLPKGCDPGWLVPDFLRDRYRLWLGDSKELLPSLLKQYGEIDVFLHDSLHTYEHQMFEYKTTWPHIVKGGMLLSDDIFWSPAFAWFARREHVPYLNLGDFGAIRVGSNERMQTDYPENHPAADKFHPWAA